MTSHEVAVEVQRAVREALKRPALTHDDVAQTAYDVTKQLVEEHERNNRRRPVGWGFDR